MGQSLNVKHNVLKDTANYRKKKSSGQTSELNACVKRTIFKAASNSALSAQGKANEVCINTNMENVQRLLKSYPTMKYKKITRKSHLTELHKKARLDFYKKTYLMD